MGRRRDRRGGGPLLAAFTEAGERAAPAPVRELPSREVLRWRGTETGISRVWCEDLLPEPDRPAGRLALLTAFASYQVDAEAVREYRRVVPADDALVELVAWSAFTATRRVGELHLPARDPGPAEGTARQRTRCWRAAWGRWFLHQPPDPLEDTCRPCSALCAASP